MRVLLTTDTVGGVWTFTRELGVQLLAAGHAVALVSFGRLPGAAQLEWVRGVQARYGEAFAYRASEAPLEWMQENAECCGAELELLARVAGEFGAELLHTSQFCYGDGWGVLPRGLPRVVTAHSDVLSWAAACRPGGLARSSWLARYEELVQRGLDGADAVVAPTAWMRDALGENFCVPGAVRVIANGRKMPAAGEAVARRLQGVTVGRLWDEAKGTDMLLELEAAMPLLVAGEERFGEARAVGGSLRALGVLGETELLRLFRESSVYVCCSRYEPFGLAPLEAALCGCAVVANDLASLREVWGEAATYYRGAEELEAVLRGLAEDGARLGRAQVAAGVRARRYSAERMAGEYVALYEGVLAQAAGGRRERAMHAA